MCPRSVGKKFCLLENIRVEGRGSIKDKYKVEEPPFFLGEKGGRVGGRNR